MLFHPRLHHQQRQAFKHALHRQHQRFQCVHALLFCGKNFLQRVGIGFGVHARRGAAQCAHGALLAHGGGNVFQQCADIGALGARYIQHILIFGRAAAVGDAVNFNGACLALHGHALTGQLIQRLTVQLDGRVHGRHLHLRANELRQHGQQFPFARRDRSRFQHSAGHIAGVGARAQF